MDKKKGFLWIFPASMRQRWEYTGERAEELQEVRLRKNQPVLLYNHQGEFFLGADGKWKKEEKDAYIATGREMEELLNYICDYSAYAFEDELRRGFLTVPGGHRIGVAGQAVWEGADSLRTLKHISYINIRVAHEKKGVSDSLLPFLYEEGMLSSTLLISPPGCGKTTLLRDLIRQASTGNVWGDGVTVGVVDERSEIAGCFRGEAQNDVGIRTDVLDGCPKALGIMMLIRSMAPSILAVDELGGFTDGEALWKASFCGCRILATIHGENLHSLREKDYMKPLLGGRFFERYVVLGKREGIPAVLGVYGKDFQVCCRS